MVSDSSADDEEVLVELFLDWEDSQSTPTPKTPEEICRERPDFVEPLKERIAAIRMVGWLSIDSSRETRPVRETHSATAISANNVPKLPGYEILEEIGRGGMGVVYKARQLSLGRFVAVKVIHGGSWRKPSLIARLRREAAALGSLNHDHVIKVHDVFDRDGFVCLVLEFIEGGNLAQQKAGTAMDSRVAAEIAYTVAMTMSDVHRTGLLHRDLKPANLLCDASGTVKISDFGLAKQMTADSGSSMTGEVIGTPSFMAPEQVIGRSADIGVWTDIYSIGATLYDFITGRPPFAGTTPVDTLAQVKEKEPVSPRLLNPKIPRDLETICLKCLEKDSHKRYADAASLAADLRCFLDGKPISARRLSALGHAWKWTKRHPERASLFASIAVGFALVIGVITWAFATISGAKEQSRVQEFYAESARIRERSIRRTPGWSWQNQKAIKRIAPNCPAKDLEAKQQLRSEATKSLAAYDVRKQREFLNGFDAYTLEFSPNGKLLLVGANIDQDQMVEVVLVDTETWETRKSIRFEGSSKWMKEKPDGVRSLTFSPDASEFYVGTRSGWIRVFETQTWTEVRQWPAHQHYVHRIRFSTDGTKLYTCSEDKTTKSWWPDGRQIHVIHGPHPMTDIAVLHDELLPAPAHIAIASLNPIIVEEADLLTQGTSDASVETSGRRYTLIAAYPEGGGWIRPNDATFEILDTHRLTTLKRFSDPRDRFRGFRELHSLETSPNGQWLVSSNSEMAKLWDLSAGECFAEIPAAGQGRIVGKFHPSQNLLAMTGALKITLYELSHGRSDGIWQQRLQQPHVLKSMALSPVADQVAAARKVEWDGEILERGQLLTQRTGEERIVVQYEGHGILNTFNQFSPDGSTIVSDCYRAHKLFFVRSDSSDIPRVVHHIFNDNDQDFLDADCGRFSSNGRLFFVAGKTRGNEPDSGRPRSGEVRVFDTDSLRSRRLWANFESEVMLRKSQILSLAVCVNFVACSSNDGSIRVLNARSGAVAAKLELMSVCDSLSRSADESRIVAGTREGVLMVLDLPSAEIRSSVRAHDGQILSTSWVTPNLIVSGSSDHVLKLWKWQDDELSELLKLDSLSGPVEELAASADGRVLAVRLRAETSIRLLRIDILRERLREYGLDW